jgi:hypothetical protein
MPDAWTSWADLPSLIIPVWAHYFTIHLPWNSSPFAEGFTYTLSSEHSDLSPMDVEFPTRQTANITLGRKSIVKVMMKIYLLALSDVTRKSVQIPHVDLAKYQCRMMDQWCDATTMVSILANLMWVYGIKP